MMAAQLDFSGGEHPYGPQFNQAVDPGLASRLDKAQRNRDVFKSYGRRDFDVMMAERGHPEGHVMSTSRFFNDVPTTDVPRDLFPVNSFRGARAHAGHMAEVPVYNYAEDKPAMASPQGEVTTSRVQEIVNDPRTGVSPRFPAHLGTNLPMVYRPRAGSAVGAGQPVLVDGNHRMTAAVLQGQMFQPARVVTDRDLPRLRADNKRIRQERFKAGVSSDASGVNAPLAAAEYNRLNVAEQERRRSS